MMGVCSLIILGPGAEGVEGERVCVGTLGGGLWVVWVVLVLGCNSSQILVELMEVGVGVAVGVVVLGVGEEGERWWVGLGPLVLVVWVLAVVGGCNSSQRLVVEDGVGVGVGVGDVVDVDGGNDGAGVVGGCNSSHILPLEPGALLLLLKGLGDGAATVWLLFLLGGISSHGLFREEGGISWLVVRV
mmetsp:Transcript_35647/g.55643  ORF Transcript_35647/g.55643 Transcript_35647/m.55643 type:complete len:187 (+) Transcript_35647:388-948(+)